MTANRPWPCPICAELIIVGYNDCPFCRSPAEWIDLIGAMDFAIRRFELWKLQGAIAAGQYQNILKDARNRRQQMIASVQTGQPVPADCGLPPQDRCWRCKTPTTKAALRCAICGTALNSPEVRLLRQQSFLCNEIQHYADAGLLSKAQWQEFISETPERQVELLGRLEQGWVPGDKKK